MKYYAVLMKPFGKDSSIPKILLFSEKEVLKMDSTDTIYLLIKKYLNKRMVDNFRWSSEVLLYASEDVYNEYRDRESKNWQQVDMYYATEISKSEFVEHNLSNKLYIKSIKKIYNSKFYE